MSDNGHDAPSIEDFRRGRAPTGMSRWLRALVPMAPTLFPSELSEASGHKAVQNSISSAARQANIKVRTLSRNGVVWVLRLPDDEVQP